MREVESAPVVATPLEEAFPEIEDFHSDGTDQRVAEIGWSGATSWSAQRYLPHDTGATKYQAITYYARSASGSTAVTFSLNDAAGRGITWTQPAFDAAWQRIDVLLVDLNVTATSATGVVTAVNGAAVAVDDDYGPLVRLELDAPSSSSNGTIQIDEVDLTGPTASVGAAVRAVAALRLPGPVLQLGSLPLLSDLYLEQSLYAATTGFGALVGDASTGPPLQSATRLEAKSLFTELQASLGIETRFGAGGGEVGVDASHSLRLPWLPARPEFPLSLIDEFDFSSRQGELRALRTVRLLITGTLASLQASSAGGATSGLLTQTTSASASFDTSILGGDARLALGRLSDADAGVVGRYAEDWLTTGGLLLLGSDEALDRERTTEVGLSARVGTQPVAGEIDADLHLRSSRFFQPKAESILDTRTALTVPISSERGFAVRPGYRRQATTTLDRVSTAGWRGEVESIGAALGLQPHMITFPPVVELAALDYADEFAAGTASANRSTYHPEVFVMLQRQFSSRIFDLVVPSRAEVSWGRTLVHEPVLTSDLTNVTVDVTAAAINLFGSRGAYPVFREYELDELVSRYQWTHSSPKFGSAVMADSSSNLILEHSVLLDFPSAARLALSNRATLARIRASGGAPADSGTDTVALTIDWSVHPDGGIPVPLVPEASAATAFLQHREDVEISLRWGTVGQTPLSGVVRHVTELVLPELGAVRGELSLAAEAGPTGSPSRATGAAGAGVATPWAVAVGVSASLTLSVDL